MYTFSARELKIYSAPSEGRRQVVESGAGAPASGSGGLSVAFAPGLSPAPVTAFPVPPLIKPDVRFSRIRLSDGIMPSPTEGSWSLTLGG